MSRKKSNEELGYVIPVMRRIEPGKYTYAYAKSLEPDSRGQIKVRTSNLKTTSWLGTSVIHVPQGFEIYQSAPSQADDKAGRYICGIDPVPNKFHAERIERVMEALPEERRKDLLFVLEANEKNLQAKTKRILRLSEAKRKGQLIRQVLETKLEDILFEQDCQEPY
jgi:hypothetical protein